VSEPDNISVSTEDAPLNSPRTSFLRAFSDAVAGRLTRQVVSVLLYGATPRFGLA